MRILEKAGSGNPVISGDELPAKAKRIRTQKRTSIKTRKQK
jgi:hypothetical protein